MSRRKVPSKKEKAGQRTPAAMPTLGVKAVTFPSLPSCFTSLALNHIVMTHWREVGGPRHRSLGIFQEPLLSIILDQPGRRQCRTEV